jgi:site-specific DNA-adenine methylase
MENLHPFFSYFGSKFRLAKYYPTPQCDEIIEPFAGSAGYALRYPGKKVTLYEVYEPLIELWDYLIHVSEEEILSLPIAEFNKENPVEDIVKCSAARTLMGFWLTESQTTSSRYPLSKSRGGNWTEKKKEDIAKQLKYIRHWKIEKLSFEQIPNRQATWYIDPPYEKAGKRYRHNKIDYQLLGEWCKSREGQVIVCEQDPAKWLEFIPLHTEKKSIRNASNEHYKEIYWHKNSEDALFPI